MPTTVRWGMQKEVDITVRAVESLRYTQRLDEAGSTRIGWMMIRYLLKGGIYIRG